jgi:large subunit ribosomal protein L21
MYAVFQVGGFQYTAEEGVTVQVPLMNAGAGDKFEIEEVMLISDGDKSQVGQPFVENAKIEAEVIGHGKGEKVVVYKAKRRTKYRLTKGHRQDYSEIKINKIVVPPSA